jgi:hypothetical protein
MIEEIGALVGEIVAVVADGGHHGFDASSPSFLAAFACPAATSLAVQDSSGEAFARFDDLFEIGKGKLLICLAFSSVETHGDAVLCHIALGLADGIGAEVEDRGGQNRGRMALV